MAIVASSAFAAPTPTTICTSETELSGKIVGNLVVPAGVTCTISNGEVTGNVSVKGNALHLASRHVRPERGRGRRRPYHANYPVIIKGNLSITGSAGDNGYNGFFGNQFYGDLQRERCPRQLQLHRQLGRPLRGLPRSACPRQLQPQRQHGRAPTSRTASSWSTAARTSPNHRHGGYTTAPFEGRGNACPSNAFRVCDWSPHTEVDPTRGDDAGLISRPRGRCCCCGETRSPGRTAP